MSQDFADFVVEQMRGFGPVQARRMFGGHGLFRDGLMFALILADTLYLKTDGQNVARFSERGLEPFSYEARGRRMSLHYHQAPGEVFDDAGAMADWARLAFDCALRKRKAVAAPRKAPGRQAAAKKSGGTKAGGKTAAPKKAPAKKAATRRQ